MRGKKALQMIKYFKRRFVRNDKKEILLFGYHIHEENPDKQLEFLESSKPHMRWHPLREEWVTYSSGRERRTFFSSEEYCPFCPSKKINYPTEIPFNSFEIAVFPNRWPSFNSHNDKYILEKVTTKISYGTSEVIVYSDNHSETIVDMSDVRLQLLVLTWIDRYKELLEEKNIKYVMPFENRGEECGVTLHHPHGQIYAYPFIPPITNKKIEIFKNENYLVNMMDVFEKKYWVYKNNEMIAVVPPFARYAYEVWIIPRRKVPGPWDLNDGEIKSFAKCIKKVVKGYDSFLKKKCPYVMGLHASPFLKDKNFHFHTEFYPPFRSGDKPKILAGSESMAGVFVMDVLPEDSAKILREHMK